MMIDGSRIRRPGGTSGGLGTFLFGFIMAVAGGYLFLDRVQIIGTSWRLFGASGFGLSLIPLLIGVFLLFIDGRSILGWLLTVGGLVIIFVGVLSHLDIFFRPTSLFETLLMLILLVGGLALIVRSFRSRPVDEPGEIV
jgi:hypothetical protein